MLFELSAEMVFVIEVHFSGNFADRTRGEIFKTDSALFQPFSDLILMDGGVIVFLEGVFHIFNTSA